MTILITLTLYSCDYQYINIVVVVLEEVLPYSNKDDINALLYNSYIIQFFHVFTYVQSNAVHVYQVRITVCIVIQFSTLFIQNRYITHGSDKPEKIYRPNIMANHQHPFEPITILVYKHVSQPHRNPMGLLV